MSRSGPNVTLTALIFIGVMAGLPVVGIAAGLVLERGASRIEKPSAVTAIQSRPEVPPEPRLQVDPLADRQVVLGPERLASTWGWTDKAKGRARMPVDDAMRMLAQQGWPQPEPGQ